MITSTISPGALISPWWTTARVNPRPHPPDVRGRAYCTLQALIHGLRDAPPGTLSAKAGRGHHPYTERSGRSGSVREQPGGAPVILGAAIRQVTENTEFREGVHRVRVVNARPRTNTTTRSPMRRTTGASEFCATRGVLGTALHAFGVHLQISGQKKKGRSRAGAAFRPDSDGRISPPHSSFPAPDR